MSFFQINPLKKIAKNFNSLLKTYSRSCLITSDFVGTRLKVHNGKDFLLLNVSTDMVGHKLGEFVWTRARYEFKKKKKKKK